MKKYLKSPIKNHKKQPYKIPLAQRRITKITPINNLVKHSFPVSGFNKTRKLEIMAKMEAERHKERARHSYGYNRVI